MAKLNEKTENTKRIIHLMITDKCNRKCPDCCNNQYDLSKIEIVTTEELLDAEIIFLTGGEPFAFGNPCEFAKYLKYRYPNIKKVMAYTNALELADFLNIEDLYSLDGVTVSIKNKADKEAFENTISNNKSVIKLESNWLYTFPGFEDTKCPNTFNKKMRYWQKVFVPATDSIFRRWK